VTFSGLAIQKANAVTSRAIFIALLLICNPNVLFRKHTGLFLALTTAQLSIVFYAYFNMVLALWLFAIYITLAYLLRVFK
jgi:hypothetical protein